MASLNRVFLIGNLTRDPDVRYAPSGDSVGDLQLAVSRRYKSRDGQDREETCFVGVVVWGRTADLCKEYLRKGSPVFVEGRLQYEQWEKDGQKNSRIRVRAERVQFLSSGKGAAPARQNADAVVRPESVPAPDDKVDAAQPSPDEDNLPF
jgi:single-strand DNA-binding protein